MADMDEIEESLARGEAVSLGPVLLGIEESDDGTAVFTLPSGERLTLIQCAPIN